MNATWRTTEGNKVVSLIMKNDWLLLPGLQKGTVELQSDVTRCVMHDTQDLHFNELDVRVILQHDKGAVSPQKVIQSGHRFQALHVEESSGCVRLVQVFGERRIMPQQQVDPVSVHPLVPDIDVQQTNMLPV